MSRNIPIKAELFPAEDAVNPYIEIFQALRQWTNNSNQDASIQKYCVSKKAKEKLDTFLKENPAMEIFFNKTKNDLINTRGIWRIP